MELDKNLKSRNLKQILRSEKCESVEYATFTRAVSLIYFYIISFIM